MVVYRPRGETNVNPEGTLPRGTSVPGTDRTSMAKEVTGVRHPRPLYCFCLVTDGTGGVGVSRRSPSRHRSVQGRSSLLSRRDLLHTCHRYVFLVLDLPHPSTPSVWVKPLSKISSKTFLSGSTTRNFPFPFPEGTWSWSSSLPSPARTNVWTLLLRPPRTRTSRPDLTPPARPHNPQPTLGQ